MAKLIEKDFDFIRGDTQPLTWDITDNNGEELDLTGAEIYFTFKNNFNTSNYIFQKKYSTGDIVIEGIKGSLVLTHNDTAELDYGKYVYDIQIKSGDYVQTLAKGQIELDKESTWKANE